MVTKHLPGKKLNLDPEGEAPDEMYFYGHLDPDAAAAIACDWWGGEGGWVPDVAHIHARISFPPDQGWIDGEPQCIEFYDEPRRGRFKVTRVRAGRRKR